MDRRPSIRIASFMLCCMLWVLFLLPVHAEEVVSLPITLEEGYLDTFRPVISISVSDAEAHRLYLPYETVNLSVSMVNGHSDEVTNVQVGVTFPSYLTLLDDSGQPIPANASGEVLGRTASVSAGADTSFLTASFLMDRLPPLEERNIQLSFAVTPSLSLMEITEGEVRIFTDHGGEASQMVRVDFSALPRATADLFIHGLGEANAPISTTFQLTALADNAVQTVASDGVHVVHFANLAAPAIYTLQETSAAAGYTTLSERWTITVAADGSISTGLQQGSQPLVPTGTPGHYQLLHQQTYTVVQMPAAGGIGEGMMHWIGMGVLCLGCVGMIIRMRMAAARKEESR